MPKKADGTGLLEEWQAWLDGGAKEKQRIEKIEQFLLNYYYIRMVFMIMQINGN